MPKQVKKKVSAGRATRTAQPTRQTKIKSKKATRSLSESRQRSSAKVKVGSGRLSVASQSVTRPAQQEKVSLSASVYNLKGKVVEKIALPKEIFGVDVNDHLMAQAVRVYLQNQRLGTSSTKTRGEVSGSTRKIYRQKGTGRARHGARYAPIFVGGGIAFGPKPRDHSLRLPSKMRKVAVISALSSKLKDGEIRVISGLEKMEPKTKIMNAAIKGLDFERKKILLVTPGTSTELPALYKAARNIEGVKILPAQMLNTYEVLDNVAIFLMKTSIEVLRKNLTGGKE